MTLALVFRRAGGFLAILALWQGMVLLEWIPRQFLPSPMDTFVALAELLVSPDAIQAEILTVLRAIAGLSLAIAFGMGLAILGAMVAPIRYMIEPITELLRPIPPAAIVPTAIFKLGIGAPLYLFVITISAMWPIYLSTVAALMGVHSTLVQTGQSFGCGRATLLFRILLPSALPEIFVGIRIAAGISLIATVVTEMLSGRNGIGYLLFYKAFALQVADVIALTLICGFNGILLTQLVRLLRLIFTRWHVRMMLEAGR